LDCREARLSDRSWWRKAHWAMAWVEKRNRNEVRKLSHDHNAALLNYAAGNKAIELHWEQALQIQSRIKQSLLPWEKERDKQMSKQRFNAMVELWEKVWGDQSDPETQKRIQWTADQLNAMALANTRSPLDGR
jgi:hypothetical protein